MDDALVLPYVRSMAPSAATFDEWPPVVRAINQPFTSNQ